MESFQQVWYELLQVSEGLMHRTSLAERQFEQVMTFESVVAPTFNMQLDCDDVIKAIQAINLYEAEG